MPAQHTNPALTVAANALLALAKRDDYSFAALRVAQRAIAQRYGYTLDGLRSALAARVGHRFVYRKLYL